MASGVPRANAAEFRSSYRAGYHEGVEQIATGCLVVIPMVVFLFMGFDWVITRDQLRAAMEAAVRPHGGEVVPGDILRGVFRVDGVEAVVSITAARTSGTILWIDLRLPGVHVLGISPRDAMVTMPPLRGARGVVLGDDAFDAVYRLECDSPAYAKAVLTSPVRDRLVAEAALGLLVVQFPTILRVQALRVQRAGRSIAPLVQAALGVLSAARSAGTAGVEVTSVGREAGACPVCGTAATEAVSCSRCGTKHHRECWDYVKRCAMYGCGATEAA